MGDVVLVVEDSPAQRSILEGFLRKKGFFVLGAACADEAVKICEKNYVDLLLTDLRLGGTDGIELLTILRKKNPSLEAIVITAYATVADAILAMKRGAYDFVSKPVDLDRLETLIEKALEKSHLQKENRALAAAVGSTDVFSNIIGSGKKMGKVLELAARASTSKASVLILGESGTGKDVLARAIHLASPRRKKPFLRVTCAALPETLIESELFGHEPGAFTGASKMRVGRFEMADGGTLFLDEIGEIPLHLQVKLLNVLQTGSFERLGGTETINSDVRIIAATNSELEKMVTEGTFREDLYYRLNVVRLSIPPLRERKEDIPELARHFLRIYSDLNGVKNEGFDESAVDYLMQQEFRGNIRELENWIERAVVLAQDGIICKDDFPEENILFADKEVTPGDGLEAMVEDLERKLILDALKVNNGNQSAAARDLKISERAIRYKIKKYSL